MLQVFGMGWGGGGDGGTKRNGRPLSNIYARNTIRSGWEINQAGALEANGQNGALSIDVIMFGRQAALVSLVCASASATRNCISIRAAAARARFRDAISHRKYAVQFNLENDKTRVYHI